MGTDGRMAIPIEQAVSVLAQWFSPAYPVGGFAYSHGLEWAIDAGDVTDARTCRNWIIDVLRHGAGWNDALFLAAAYRADSVDEVQDLDASSRAFAASAERLRETHLQGAAFCAVTSSVWGIDLPALCYPVAVGRAAALTGLPPDLVTQMYLQAFASNLVSAAMRLVPLGQTEGQTLIRDLTPACSDIASRATRAGLDALTSTSFLADIASMKHETQYSRIFRT